jgi:hypothetical protein
MNVMRCKSLWRWYICTNITFLEIIHRSVYISKQDVSESEFCLPLQTKPTQLGAIDRASSCFQRDGDRIQFPKCPVLKYKQDSVLDRNRKMETVQKPNIRTDEILCWEVWISLTTYSYVSSDWNRTTYMHIHYSSLSVLRGETSYGSCWS